MTNYGFVIDNRKCIGCHACTVACKAEHDVPVGVNRTWVKYIEKGEFPNTRRLFSVMRCNHCENAPCVSICPVTALYTRDDGIVDFDGSRCIGCKSCMQACPYDALYIDPNTNTAAKCNYCSNRVEIGLEPACVTVCPEKAIIAGDLDNPNTQISQLIALETVSVRKEEKGTIPNVFYIDGDKLMLNPSNSSARDNYMSSSQGSGVGHYAGHKYPSTITNEFGGEKIKRVYDAPSKGRLWAWQVPSYLLTKGISAGIGMIFAFIFLFGKDESSSTYRIGYIIALLALIATAGLLVWDLDQPKRFHTILLRPNFSSWLTKGAFIISMFGVILFGLTVFPQGNDHSLINLLLVILGFLSAVYTAFLFAQAKGRDYWQSSLLPFEMTLHSLILGSGVILFLQKDISQSAIELTEMIFLGSIVISALFILSEMTITHATNDAQITAKAIKFGKWRLTFWGGVLLSIILPIAVWFSEIDMLMQIGYISPIMGIYLMNRALVYAPQDISLV